MLLSFFKKLRNTYNFRSLKSKYNKEKCELEQTDFFHKLGLDREAALIKLNQIKKQNSFLNRNMSSEHEVLFSAISIKYKTNFKNILEIGTYDGVNSFLLSSLFENAKILTLDLPSTDQEFKETYNRKKYFDNFVLKRNEIISKKKNIDFKELNSVELINHDNKFDLIWIDGAHGYPVVSIDIINSLRLINDQGIIMCDDVFMVKPKKQDPTYRSIASYETLKILHKQNLINLNFIYKRLDALSNCDPNLRKYVGFIKKKF